MSVGVEIGVISDVSMVVVGVVGVVGVWFRSVWRLGGQPPPISSSPATNDVRRYFFIRNNR
jgi:hypothetical protein